MKCSLRRSCWKPMVESSAFSHTSLWRVSCSDYGGTTTISIILTKYPGIYWWRWCRTFRTTDGYCLLSERLTKSTSHRPKDTARTPSISTDCYTHKITSKTTFTKLVHTCLTRSFINMPLKRVERCLRDVVAMMTRAISPTVLPYYKYTTFYPTLLTFHRFRSRSTDVYYDHDSHTNHAQSANGTDTNDDGRFKGAVTLRLHWPGWCCRRRCWCGDEWRPLRPWMTLQMIIIHQFPLTEHSIIALGYLSFISKMLRSLQYAENTYRRPGSIKTWEAIGRLLQRTRNADAGPSQSHKSHKERGASLRSDFGSTSRSPSLKWRLFEPIRLNTINTVKINAWYIIETNDESTFTLCLPNSTY